jgi:hypothetical protein
MACSATSNGEEILMIEKEKKTKTRKNVTTAVQSDAGETAVPKKTRKKASPVAMLASGTAPKKKTTRTKPMPKVTEIGVSHEEIARLAHRYWAERGGQHGHHEEDWLRAERELLGKAS